MFQTKGITALGQGIVAFIGAIIFPLAGLALLETALSIDESDREQSAYYLPICMFVLGFVALVIAIWRFARSHHYSKLAEPEDHNPKLASYSDAEELEEIKLEEKLDAQTRKFSEEN